MELVIAYLNIFIGLLILVTGGELIVRGAVNLAFIMRISKGTHWHCFGPLHNPLFIPFSPCKARSDAYLSAHSIANHHNHPNCKIFIFTFNFELAI